MSLTQEPISANSRPSWRRLMYGDQAAAFVITRGGVPSSPRRACRVGGWRQVRGSPKLVCRATAWSARSLLGGDRVTVVGQIFSGTQETSCASRYVGGSAIRAPRQSRWWLCSRQAGARPADQRRIVQSFSRPSGPCSRPGMIVSAMAAATAGHALNSLESGAGWAALSTRRMPVYLRLAQITKRSIEATLRRTTSPVGSSCP